MIVGIPSEVKTDEWRVAITPAGVRELTSAGHTVLVEKGAGDGSSMPDAEFVRTGAKIVDDPDDVWAAADLVLQGEGARPRGVPPARGTRQDQILFTYLHLAASRECTDALVAAGNVAIAYETVRQPDNSLPLLAPMSEVAGRMAPADGRAPPDAARRRAGRARVRRARGALRPHRHPRRRRGRLRGGHHGRGHALGGVRPRPQPRQAARGRPPLPGRARDGRLLGARHRGGLPRGRHRHRRRAGRRRPGAPPRLRRAGRADAAGLGPGRHLRRPGRLLRVDPPDHALEPDLRGARVGLLLRGQHARRGAAHLDPRAGQRHPALHAAHRRPGVAGGGPGRPGAGRGGQRGRRPRRLRPVAEAHGLPYTPLDELLD